MQRNYQRYSRRPTLPTAHSPLLQGISSFENPCAIVDPHAPVAQLAEATDSKPVQCEFESHMGHRTKSRDTVPGGSRDFLHASTFTNT